MHVDFSRLTHAGIQALEPYVPGKTIEAVAKEQGLTDIIKLASNENAWGFSPAAHQALCKLSNQTLSLYPSSVSHAFRHKIANFLGIETDGLILNNGSDSLISLLLICFALHQDKHVITHDHAFCAYAIQSKTLGIPIISTPTHNWRVDIDAIIAACNHKTALIFIANPNNPTGMLIEYGEIKRLLSSIPKTTILVLDEAYYEYAYAEYHENSLDLLAAYPNLIIARTFSKAYGLAGLRLGYACAQPQIIKLLYSIQLPFAVNIAAMTAAEIAIDDQDFIQKTIQLTTAGIKQIEAGLKNLHIHYLPTTTNFITMQCPMDGNIMFQKLQAHGIIVRPLHVYGMNDYIRVTVGTPEQNTRFLQALQEIISK